MSNTAYNDRLFNGGGLRRWFHMARFWWLFNECNRLADLDTSFVMELGCFDARSLAYISPPPKKYIGYDAGWEGGIDLARERYSNHKLYEFIKSVSPEDICESHGMKATLTISLETLEHVPPEMINRYITKLSEVTNGYLILTVPNEKGLVFLIKHIVKLLIGCGEEYTFKELVCATLGMLDKVPRNEHKGFDYDSLCHQISKNFVLVRRVGVQFPFLPEFMNVQIGMVFRSSQ